MENLSDSGEDSRIRLLVILSKLWVFADFGEAKLRDIVTGCCLALISMVLWRFNLLFFFLACPPWTDRKNRTFYG